jgi:hypothetical protein
MSDAMMPSWRPARRDSAAPWLMLGFVGILLALVGLGAGAWYLWSSAGPRGVPVIEADPRPFKVRPDDPGGTRVPNQDSMALARPGERGAPPRGATPLPVQETPAIDRLREAVQPPPALVAPALVPAGAPRPQPAAPVAAPAPAPAAPAAAAPVAAGRQTVQLGALASAEAARAEWDRLAARAPELMRGRSPQILRLEREGTTPLFRLRTTGFADAEAARAFCEQLRARGGACVPIRG